MRSPLTFFLMLCAVLAAAAETPLVTLEYQISGTQLKVTPAVLSVPKGVAGSILVQVVNGSGETNLTTGGLTEGAFIEATLRGPSFEARRIVGPPNSPLLLPLLPLVGDYQLDNIRLVENGTGNVRMEGAPSSVPIRVFDEVLVSKVVSRPLTSDEIKEKGIAIDDKNFRAVEFEVGFVLDGKTVPVKFPVVAPRFEQSTEIIPKAELDRRLAEATAINQQIAATATLPPELSQSQLNIEIQGINFQRVEDRDVELGLKIPPIPALMVIPGNIGYLNQFFSVQIFTENGAPQGSGLSVFNVQAELVLPPGPDRVASTNYNEPGDDPLRFARIGPDKIIQPIQPVVRPGPDGKIGTSDDIGRLQPGESGQGEFLVEGLQEGLHVMDLNLTADLEGLAAGTVKIKGKAAGSVLVRNPKFSLAFTHPRTVRAGEPYEASVTVLNTGNSPANFVSVTLSGASLSGGVLESSETVQLGDILPGQTATARWRVRAQRTGAISFSNLTTGDDSVQGRFRLKMGIDERGVALSPDSIAMPDFANSLPTNLLIAANRVLGQALSVATAAQLPPGVKPVNRGAVTRRVLELAEAGQRLRYGDSLPRVLTDLLLDWQGQRFFSDGFDQIIRETDAGREWRQAIMNELESGNSLDATARLIALGQQLAGRGESFAIAASSDGAGTATFGDGFAAAADASHHPRSAVYSGLRGSWIVSSTETNATYRWHFDAETNSVALVALLVETNGTAQQMSWTIDSPSTNACYSFDLPGPSTNLVIDLDCDGSADQTRSPTITAVNEAAPEIVSVRQDLTVHTGRPPNPCLGGVGQNYGTVLAVLFSKPMTQEKVNAPERYRLDNGNVAGSVQIQPGGRVALLNMRLPVSAIHPRTITVDEVTDSRGHPVVSETQPVLSDVTSGTAIRGRVVRADGSSAGNIPVTLTMYEMDGTGFDCVPFVVRVAQVFSDPNGFFVFDYVMSGIPYSVSATDTAGLPPAAVGVILESAAGDAFARDKLLELANSPGVQNTLLGAFATATLPEAVAKAEGLDRAILRDEIAPGSPRENTETTVALRFRGRGIVTGRILAADGATPVGQVAVNLFPDPDSREQGRGIFSDGNGQFAFQGVPLGIFSIQAQSPDGLFRTVSGVLDQPGQVRDLSIVLSATAAVRAEISGRVLETDHVTPHPGAQVFVGRYKEGSFGNVVAVLTADSGGFWAATNIPANTYDLVAVSFDGKRTGERRDIPAVPDLPAQVTIALGGRATVIGRVETSTGQPVANALVAGGETIVRTDINGLFTLPGVPTGHHSLSAGLERNPSAGIDFPRLGSAEVEVVAGVDNFAVIRLRAAGRIVGRVLDVIGQPVPGVRVALPQDGGFLWTETDGQGDYKFENLPLGGYTLSAPAGPAENTDTSGLINKIKNGSEEEVLAAIGEAFAIFSGAADPYLNGEGVNFNPRTWGFNRTTIRFDGESARADIKYLREGTVSGIVINGQGVPIGARVRLTGIGPLPTGLPSTVIRGEANTDPALGTFSFPGQLLAGDWGLQAASPFYPRVITASGHTTVLDPDATNIVLQFPAVTDVNGRLRGMVFSPQGEPVTNVNVKISFGNDYIIRTDITGTYDTGGLNLPAGNYSVQAEDPVTGLRGSAGVFVAAGTTNLCDVRLLGKGTLNVTVLRADGTVASGAHVEILQGGFPSDQASGIATNGLITFGNLSEGAYAASASQVSGPTTIMGRAGAIVRRDETNAVTVYLAPTATIRGTFVTRDLVTPVAFAQIAVGSLGFAATDTNGFFEVIGVPLGTYRLSSQDPVNGIGAVITVTLAAEGEVRNVTLVEQARGEIKGAVIDSYGSGFVPGATVTATFQDGISPSRTVSTGPDGRFSFPGSPAGPFTLEAIEPISGLRGANSAVLPETAPVFEINVPLQPLASIAIRVFRPDGVTVVTNASVSLVGPRNAGSDTDGAGIAHFAGLPLGFYTVRAASLALVETHSAMETNIQIATAGTLPEISLRLSGVGSVSGQVLKDGIPSAGASVTLKLLGGLFPEYTEDFVADSTGHYSFDNIPVGAYRLTATAQALGASFNGTIAADGATNAVNVNLGPSGTIMGRLLRADGATPASSIDVLVTFQSQSGLPGQALIRTGAGGEFQFQNIPVGPFDLEAIAPDFLGLVRLHSSVAANGTTNQLSDVLLDEADPRVVRVSPINTAANVSTLTTVELFFSEPLLASSVNATGIYLRYATNPVPAAIQLLDSTNGPRTLVRLTPSAPLVSEKTYDVIVIDGTRSDALGGLTARGPTDMQGRILPAPFVSRFTTADNDPPLLVSLFPTNGSTQIDPRAVMRASFNEPVRSTGLVVSVTGPAGPVAGITSVGLNGLAVVFTPNAELLPNSTYSLSVSNVFDLAGNPALNQPFNSSFASLDTVGPAIASLQIADGRLPVGGASVPFEAILQTPEPGVTVRFTRDFVAVGAATDPPYRVNIALSPTGTNIIRAIAADRFNNSGEVRELAVAVVSNQPPAISLERAAGQSGPVPSGSAFAIVTSASDDVSVTNISVAGFGSINFGTNFNNGTQRQLTLQMPVTAVAGLPVQFRAQATDGLGLRSIEAILNIDVIDATPPSLAVADPTNHAVIDPAQGLQLQVAASDNSTNYTLQVVLSGAVAATQTVTVATSPNTVLTNLLTFSLNGAPTNGASFDASISATDDRSNSISLIQTYLLPDTTPPTILSFAPTNGAARVNPLTAIDVNFSEPMDPATINAASFVLRNASGQMVSGSYSLQNGNRTARFQPGSVLAFGTPYTVELNGLATDPSSNALVGATAAFTTASNLPPILTFERGNPVTGPIGSGQTLILDVGATSDLGIANLALTASGALNVSDNYGNGTLRSLFFTVPANTIPGTPLQFRARATDTFGGQSIEGVIDYVVVDRTPPALAIRSPDASFVQNPAQSLQVVVVSADNGGDHQLRIEVSGAITSTQTVNVAAGPNISSTNTVTFSLAGVATNGAALTLTVRGSDTAGNDSSTSTTLHLLDKTGPKLTGASPADGAIHQSLWLNAVLFQFDEPIASASISTNTITITNNAGRATPYSLSQDSSSVVRLTPTALPLAPGATYTNRLLAGITDLFGNPLTRDDGTPLPPEGLVTTFATAAILSVSPTNNAVVPPGAGVDVTVHFEAGLGADFFRFTIDGGAPYDVPVFAGSTNASISIPIAAGNTNQTNAILEVTAVKSGAVSYPLPPITLHLNASQSNTNEITFIATNTVTLMEGQSTNLNLWINSPDSPLTLLDYAATNLPPTFASLGGLQITNSATNGTASAALSLNPLHDAAGQYTITLRAAARSGKVGLFHIDVTILDDPSLLVTRWKDPVDGDWNDASRWTAGVPDTNTIAVIDVPGAYTVNGNVQPMMRAFVLNETNAIYLVNVDMPFDAPAELRAGGLTFSFNRSLAVNQPFVNQGTIRLYSRDVADYLGGTSRIENRGLIEVDPWGGGGSPAHIYLPIRLTGAGRLFLANGILGFHSGSSLLSSGTVEVQTEGRLLFLNELPAHDMTILAGCQLIGDGTLEFYGDSQFVLAGDVATSLRIQMRDSSRTAGTGTLTLLGNQTLTGNYGSPVLIAPGASVGIFDATFTNVVTIQSNGVMYLNLNRGLTINGILNNLGTLQLYSRDVNTYVGGSGLLENQGVIQIDPWGGGGGQAQFFLPVHIGSSGRLLLSSGYANFRAGSSLTSAGIIDVQGDSRLLFQNENPVRELTVLPGCQLIGSGTLEFYGNNRLVMATDASASLRLQMQDSSQVAGPGTLSLEGIQTLTGTYNAPIAITPGASVGIINATFNGRVTIQSNGLMYLNFNCGLVINDVLNNFGTLQLYSRDVNTYLSGTGHVENPGLIRVDPWGGGGGQAQILLPVLITGSGRVLVVDGNLNFRAGGTLTSAGTIEVQGDSRLWFQNESFARDLTVLPGCQLIGNGTLEFYGNNQLVLVGDVASALRIQMHDSSKTTGSAVLTFLGAQTLTGTYGSPVVIGAGASVGIINASFNAPVTIQSNALMYLNFNCGLVINDVLNNFGTLQLYSRDVNTYVSGSGHVDNDGLIRVDPWGGGGGQAQFLLPVQMSSAGRFLTESGNINFRTGGTLTSAGTIEIKGEGKLLFQNESAARDLTVLDGGQFLGDGTLQFYGSNRLFMAGDATLPLHLQMFDSSQTAGPGTLTLAGSQDLTGTYGSPVALASNAVVGISDTRFTNSLTIQSNGWMYLNFNRSLILDGVLTNFGTLQFYSRDVNTYLSGNGHVENAGVVRSDAWGGGGGQAQVFLPIQVTAAGRLVAGGASYLNFRAGGSLTAAGSVEVDGGASLWFENGSPQQKFTLENGATVSVAGNLAVYGNDMIFLSGAATLQEGMLNLVESSLIAGPGTLTVGSNATLRIDHSTVASGSFDVYGTFLIVNASSTVGVLERVALFPGGILNNPGTVQVRAFINNGGTVIGNAPEIIAPGPNSIRISLAPVTGARPDPEGVRSETVIRAAPAIVLIWRGPADTSFKVESSSDFLHWTEEKAVIEEAAPGKFTATLPVRREGIRFFRVRR